MLLLRLRPLRVAARLSATAVVVVVVGGQPDGLEGPVELVQLLDVLLVLVAVLQRLHGVGLEHAAPAVVLAASPLIIRVIKTPAP